MIKFRSILEQLIEELKPLGMGHMGVSWDAGLMSYIDYEDPRFGDDLIAFLKQNDIEHSNEADIKGGFIPQWINENVSDKYVPEVLYFGLTRYPETFKDLTNPTFAKEGNYRFMLFDGSEGMMDLIFLDDGAGQALGMMKVDYPEDQEQLTPSFKRKPVQVHLSKVIPTVRGTGEGHKMYSLLLNKFGTITSDTTLFGGSFAMWDTTIRQSAPYSGVTAFGDKLVYNNSKGDVYTMSLPNRSLDRFWASKTISPWVLNTSKALSKLDAKTTLVAELQTAKSVPLVVDIIDKVSDDNSINDLLDYLDKSNTDSPFIYNTKYIRNPQTLLLFVTKGGPWIQETLEGIVRVDQKGANLKVTLL